MPLKLLPVLLAFLLLAGCSDPKDTVIPADFSQWETELRPALERLSREDRSYLVAYLARTKQAVALNGQAVPSGVKVRQAIAEEQEFERAEAVRQMEVRVGQLRQEQRRRELERQVENVLSISLTTKVITPGDLSAGSRSEQATLGFDLRNVGDRSIVGLGGAIRLSDGFGDLRSIRLDYPDSIPVGATVRWEMSLVLGLSATEDLRLHNADAVRVRAWFTPGFIEFADGSRLEATSESATR